MRQVAWASKFCTVGPNILGFSVWIFLHVTLLLTRILKSHVDFWKICAPLLLVVGLWTLRRKCRFKDF
jgi:hypothetical protein